MADGAVHREIRVREIGADAAAALAAGEPGRVAAVFARAVYVQTGTGWLCFGPPDLGSGPLNLLCDIGNDVDWRAAALAVGGTVDVSPRALAVEPGLVLALDRARLWHPAVAASWDMATLRKSLAVLENLPGSTWPQAGLGRFLHPAPAVTSPEARKAEPAVKALRAWLAGAVDGLPDAPAQAAISLLGLGPGLTPAGDDFLGGLLIALRLTGRNGAAGHLWRALALHVPVRTTAVSAAHLRAAAAGRGSAPLHAALHALLVGRIGALPEALARVGRIGHTSGWDALAGAVTALRAGCAAAAASAIERPPS